MSRRTKLAAGVLGVSLLLGVLGDVVLRVWPWGINAGLWTAVLVLAVVAVSWWAGLPLQGGGRWLVAPVLGFAFAVAWRDSPVLTALNLLAVVACLVLAALYTREGRLRIGGLIQHFVGAMLVGLMAAIGAMIVVFEDLKWTELQCPRGWGQALAILRGTLLTVPVLLVFGGLLISADAAFAGLVGRLFQWDLTEAGIHCFVVGLVAWPVSGVLRQTLLADQWKDPWENQPPFIRLGTIEMGIVVGALELLFLAFVLVQFRYFFGGASLVETSATLTYSEYARRGFFELVYVALFALPLLLAVHWAIPPQRPGQERWFRWLAGGMIALLFVIMWSALQRMRLYTEAFGLTELRLYPTAFLGWLAIVFVWFGVTVLRGKRESFIFGTLMSALLVLGVLNVANPDELIARVNVGRPTTYSLDGSYLAGLSADAVPALVMTIDAMSAEHQPPIAAEILHRWSPPRRVDWRTTNWSRAQAWQTVAAHEARLKELAETSRPQESNRADFVEGIPSSP